MVPSSPTATSRNRRDRPRLRRADQRAAGDRVLELLATDTLAPDIARIVADRLHATLALGRDGG